MICSLLCCSFIRAHSVCRCSDADSVRESVYYIKYVFFFYLSYTLFPGILSICCCVPLVAVVIVVILWLRIFCLFWKKLCEVPERVFITLNIYDARVYATCFLIHICCHCCCCCFLLCVRIQIQVGLSINDGHVFHAPVIFYLIFSPRYSCFFLAYFVLMISLAICVILVFSFACLWLARNAIIVGVQQSIFYFFSGFIFGIDLRWGHAEGYFSSSCPAAETQATRYMSIRVLHCMRIYSDWAQ